MSEAPEKEAANLKVSLKPDHAFGLYINNTQYGNTGYIRDSLGYLAENKVIFPVGQKAA